MCYKCEQTLNLKLGENQEREVLPTNVTPTRYHLTLEPFLDTFKFDGTVKIELDVNETSTEVSLNTLDLELHSAAIGSVAATETKHDEEKQWTTFVFPEGVLVEKTKQTLEIKFTGTLNDNMAGFYRSSYKDETTGETKYLATTQMEPTDARRAFPCFDEPALKAVFDISLISDAKLTHLSNMDVKSEEQLADGKKITHFNPTPLMSTYLVAFIVGDLRYVECNDFRIPVRVYATPGLEHQGQFSADLTAKTLQFFEETFGIQYPLPKVDNVAIADFSAGAMENWGLITYRIVDLLFDEENSNLTTKQRVAEVVQHELAHQWFGNLVTMDWWEGLWLNEGFATWMSWFSCNKFYPEWKVWEQYVSDSLQHALQLDSLRSSHPIEVPVKKADEINQIFDAISYSKGSSLLKMISKWLGEDVFIKGVSNYLEKHKFGNTQTGDLWAALSEASGKDVVKVMDVWTKKIGYPVIKVEENGNEVTVTQHRYLTTGDVKPEEDETIFPVFLGLKTCKQVDESLVLDTRSKTITIPEGESFVKFNADAAGIYRTAYSDERWAKLGESASQLSVEDRTGLVADAGALSTSGYTATTNLLQLVSAWKNESSFIVWDEMLGRISALKTAWLFEDKEVKEALNAYTRALVSEKCHELGWKFTKDESFESQKLKAVLFGAAVGAQDPVVEKAALDMFAAYVAGDKKAIDPNLRASVFNTAARKGGAAEYEQILNIYNNPLSVDEKLAALTTLGRFEQPELLARTFGYMMDGTVRTQDIYKPMAGMRASTAGVEALWKWTQENWEEVTKRLPPGLSMLGSVVGLATGGFTSKKAVEEIREFFSHRSTKGFDQGLAQSLDSVTAKANWVARDGKAVAEWLKEHNN